MTQVIAFSCPVCGGPLDPTAERCGFCGSYIVIKSDLPRLKPASMKQSVIRDHIQEFRRRTYQDPRDQEAHYGLGVAYFSLGLTEEAIEELTVAAKLKPEDAEIQTQLGVVLRDAWLDGNRAAGEKMRDRVDTAVMLDPENTEANLLKGRIALDDQLFVSAVDLFHSMPSTAQQAFAPVLVTSLTALCQQRLENEEWEAARWCWLLLERVDEPAGSDLVCSFLKMHPALIPGKFKTGAEGRHQPKETGVRRWSMMISVGFGGFVVGTIQLMIFGALAEPLGGVGSILVLLSFLLWLVSPVLALVWFRRRSRNAAAEGSSPQKETTVHRKEIVACNADFMTLDQVANAMVGKLRL